MQGGIIANPNCSTIIALMAVTPLHRVAGVKRIVVSTYQVIPSRNVLLTPFRFRCPVLCRSLILLHRMAGVEQRGPALSGGAGRSLIWL